MTHFQYLPGDPRLVDQLVNELKSKGLFDQFRKECIADVDTKPAYQNLRQRVETSVAAFLFRQQWKPDMNKNQLREKLRKHILDGNYLEQGLERIVDQVVNPKVASVFIPQVEDLVYNYLGIARKKTTVIAETTNKEIPESLLPTDLEAVSPGSVKSDSEKETVETASDPKNDDEMEVDVDLKLISEDNTTVAEVLSQEKTEGDTQLSGISDLTLHDSDVSLDNTNIPLPSEHIKPENIPPPVNSPPKIVKIELEKIQLPKEPNLSTDIPLPDEIHKEDKEQYFKPINSEDDSSSDSSLRRNMSPLTPIRDFINENSCDAQQAFENSATEKSTKEPSSFRFTIEKTSGVSDGLNTEKKDPDQTALSYQFTNQININSFNTPLYDDSSNSNHLRIDYESDANSKTNTEKRIEVVASQSQIDQHSEDTKKEKTEEKKNVHKSSHRSRDSHRYSSNSKDRRSDSKHSGSRDRKDSKNEKKSRDDHNKTKHTDKSRDKSDKKDGRDSSKHRSSSHRSSSHKDSKPHRSSSSSSSHRNSSKQSDDKKTSSHHKDKNEKSSDKTSRDKNSKDSKNTHIHRSDKDKKDISSKSKHEEKEKKDKKVSDDHYSLSGRGNPNRRSTDRDSNDGSSSSKGSHNQPSTKSSETKNSKSTGSKSENTSTSSDSTGPSDNDHMINESANERKDSFMPKPIVRIDSHLGIPISEPPRLPFVPDITLRKPKFAANFEEAKKMMKMRKFLDEEQKRMNQEAALLLEFQANVRPSLSQVYSSVPGPELEFICGRNSTEPIEKMEITYETNDTQPETAVQVNTYEVPEETVLTDNQYVQQKKLKDIGAELVKPVIKKEESQILQDTVLPNKDGETVLTDNHSKQDKKTPDVDAGLIKSIIKKKESGILKDIILPNKDKRDFNTFTLEYSDINNLNISKEYIAEVIGINTLEANVEVEKSQVNDTYIREAQTEIIDVDDEEDSKKYFEVTIINEPEDVIDRHSVNPGNSNIEKDDKIDKSDQSVHEFESVKIGEINKEYIAEVIGINNPDNKLDIDESKKIQKLENVIEIRDDEYKDTAKKQYFEVTVITEEVSEEKESENEYQNHEEVNIHLEEKPLEYFGEQEKFNAEIEKEKFDSFLKKFTIGIGPSNKIYLINCDAYEEKILKEVSETFGQFQVINYHKNGCLKLPKPTKNVVKDVNINMEIQLPVEGHTHYLESMKSAGDSPLFSPTQSEYAFDIPTDYNAKLDEMMKKASKRDIMEIILGIPDESPGKDPKIDYCSDSNLESDETNLKRKLSEDDCPNNNNKNVLTPKKMRRLSGSDQITSTTEETEETISSRSVNNTRSKYLGKAGRVGLPRPKRCLLPNSPSSDKSVENYEQNLQKKTPNGKLKIIPRSKVQRYDTSDLYKPKLHYLSRRNNIT